MTTDETVLRALEGAWRVSYQSLLDRIYMLGEQPCGMIPVLERLQRVGVIRLLDRQGRPWPLVTDESTRGPMYVELRAPISAV